MRRKTRIPLLVLVLVLVASTLAMAGVAVAGTPTTTIFEIGDREPGSTSAVGMSEFKQSAWNGIPQYTCDGCDASDMPAGVISTGNSGTGNVHDQRGVVTLDLAFDLEYDFIDLTLSLAKFGVESDSVVVVDTAYAFTAPGAGEGVWNQVDLEIPALAAGPHTIEITLAASPQGNGAHVWDWLMLTGDQVPVGEITSPASGDILLTGDMLMLGATYIDDDSNGVQWAVREGTCAANTDTVAGNVDGFASLYTFIGDEFASMIDTSGWAVGDYCFIFNPRETGNEPNMRLTQWFRVADGHINGGGQIIQDDPDSKKPFKVSFGGHLWQFDTAAECDWTVQFHKVSIEDVTGGTFHGSSCTAPGDYPDNGADGVTNFAIYGSFDGEPGYTVIVRGEDYTEPGSDDTIRFELLHDPAMTATPANSLGRAALYDTSDLLPGTHDGGDFVSGSNNSGSARTLLDRGNVQIDMR
ncbi:MAG: hypothetical protein ACR2N9_00585 [Acidimicrobiia bacterium]